MILELCVEQIIALKSVGIIIACVEHIIGTLLSELSIQTIDSGPFQMQLKVVAMNGT